MELQAMDLFILSLNVAIADKRLKSILIVDDSPVIAERLRHMLESVENAGLIGHAADYASAVRQLGESQPDFVLLDIHLPSTNGIALLEYIKRGYSSTIVIMITNQPDDYYRRICQRMGADYFIDKSADFEMIPFIISS